jgi:hypothetical protein
VKDVILRTCQTTDRVMLTMNKDTALMLMHLVGGLGTNQLNGSKPISHYDILTNTASIREMCSKVYEVLYHKYEEL